MPFDFQKYDAQCATMTTEQLLAQHKHYTKLSAGAMTGTAVSALSIPLTLGVSGLAIGLSAGAHHNAKKKKLIVEKYLKARGIEGQQATQYAGALANDQAQKQWMEQQQWQASQSQAGSKDVKYNYNNHDEKYHAEKKSSKGPMSSGDEHAAPPPPTYDEASSSSPSPSYSATHYGQQQQQPNLGWNPAQMGYGPPQQGWGQSPQMYGYGAPQGWGQGDGCAPRGMNMYPGSAMYAGGRPMGEVDDRHVRFAQ